MKKNKTVKVFAILGLLGIIASVVGTGILVLTSPTEPQTYEINNQELTPENLQKIIDQNKVEVKTFTGETK
ncbi:MAG: hypothetical protein Q9M94_04005 [Candidatus Gracilibacteria bacterium]|nr:hypothetical protein [Candidatus Gracilibacteria bacterium]MDQ7023243.1 hypothetical protein [Candidatus Gracilibacteria bacterium]